MSTKVKNYVVVIVSALLFVGFMIAFLIIPKKAYSQTERRKLEQKPLFNAEQVFSGKYMSNFEKYTLDQFPLRDTFRTIKASTNFFVFLQKENNDFYYIGDSVSKLNYPKSSESIDYVSGRFNYIYNKYMKDKNVNAYITVVPDKNAFMASENGYPCLDYEAFQNEFYSKCPDFKPINVLPLLSLDDYYNSDPHWKQENIKDISDLVLTSMGNVPSWTYENITLENDFKGVYYGQMGLKLKADKITYLNNDLFKDCTVIDKENNKEMGVYNLEKGKGADPYELYLSGSLSYIEINNPNATTDKELVIFRDSFGSSIAPLLIESYKKVTVLDIRYILPDMVCKMVSFDDADVLFLYSTLVLNVGKGIIK